MATLMHPDGRAETVQPRDGKRFTLPEYYEHLQCKTVQVVELTARRTMWLDEQAKLQPVIPPVNEAATHLLWMAGGRVTDVVVGRALICEPAETGDEEGA